MSNIRTPEEKERIIKEYLNGKGIRTIEKEYQVRNAQVYRWLEKYEKYLIISFFVCDVCFINNETFEVNR